MTKPPNAEPDKMFHVKQRALEKVVGYDVPRETMEGLLKYEKLLHKWQKTINLVGPNTLKDSWERHFLDSAQILPFLPPSGAVYDLGSGAGFPGLVVASLATRLGVALLESDQRKASFLRTVSRETGVRAEVVAQRIEGSGLGAPDAVTARALAPLKDLLSFCDLWLAEKPTLVGVFLKGAQWRAELEEAEVLYRFDLEDHEDRFGDGRILVVRNIQRLDE